jgi:hypothetical protein
MKGAGNDMSAQKLVEGGFSRDNFARPIGDESLHAGGHSKSTEFGDRRLCGASGTE